MLTSPTLRSVALGAGAVALAITLTAAPALTLSPSSSAAAAVPTCVPGYADYPNLTAGPSAGTDYGVSLYAAGDFTTSAGAVEGEGQFIVGGDASFAGDHFSLGVVGVGSRVDPPAGSDMLVSGGDVTVTDGVLDVGDRIGGNIVSGGTVAPRDLIETNGGSITENAAEPLAPYAAVATHYAALSADAAATPDTGETRSTADDVTFTGDNASAVQAFTVSGTDLGALGATKTMIFAGIPTDAVVIVNVTGATPVLSANTFELNGTSIVPDSASDQLFSRFTQSLLWNFGAADSVTLGDHDQLLGSVLVPRAHSSTTLLTSTNGRVFAGGDVTFGDGVRDGLELHNYPVREPIECETPTGTLSVTKALDDPDSVVEATREFTGGYECRDAADAVVATGDWSLRAGETFESPALPTGSDCVVTEDALRERPTQGDDSYHWGEPAISPANVTITDSATPVAVTVTNSVHRLTGDLGVRKILDDPDGVVSPGRQFSGTFSCDYNGVDVTPADNEWSVTAGTAATTIATGLPEGAQCALVEDTLTERPLAGSVEYGWATPLYSAASVSIDHTAVATVVVTNIVGQVGGESQNPPGGTDDTGDTGDGDSGVVPAAGPGGSGLAATGVAIAGPLALAGGLLGLGFALVVIARRRNLPKRG